ncbi:caspase family protein [Thiocystis violacea]|uniref:caspase family protein n=1 Tax=Thiocystis violacea TaxID=13725 RepID=UPI001907F85A|nr:caspase family protein [Thiocystis violacea]
MPRTFRHLPLLLTAALLATSVGAADRALLVGVGNYRNETAGSKLNLPGIDLDLEMMRGVAADLGFDPRNTKALLDAAATQSAVQQHLTVWLRDGVSKNDRILIYFSTHGTQVADLNGDEDDGLDEALTLYDLAAITTDGQGTLTGILLDDDLERALSDIPSRDILVLVDACHSGTATRSVRFNSKQSGTDGGVTKFFAYPGMPRAKAQGVTRSVGKRSQEGYVSLSAAADDERSHATVRGSLFTQGLVHAIGQAVSTGGGLTPNRLRDQAAVFVAERLGQADRDKLFNPQIGGNPMLADKPLRLVSVTQGHGPNWQRIEALAKTMTPLQIQANRQRFRVGETLELMIEVPHAGYLNVINIDARDTPIVAFPNGFHRDNRVSAGRVSIPGDLAFDLPATPPYGPTLLVAFLTDAPINLFETGDGRRDLAGNLLDDFPQPSRIGMRGFHPTAKASAPGAAGLLEVEISP